MRKLIHGLVFGVLLTLPGVAPADELPKRFTLGRYIPADVLLYVHGVSNPERAWLDEEWQEVFDALKKTGIDRDLTGLVLSFAGDGQRADVEAAIEKWTGLLAAVRWGDLVGEEVAFAERMPPAPVGSNYFGPEYIALFRGSSGSGEHNSKAMGAILEALAGLTDKLSFRDLGETDGIRRWRFAVDEGEAEPFALNLFRRGDLVGLASTDRATEQVLGLMRGEAGVTPVTASPRLHAALSQVKPPEDELTFFDARVLLTDLRGLMQRALEQADNPAEAKKAIGVFSAIMDRADVVDYSITTVETRGRTQHSYCVTRLQPGKQDSDLAKVFLDRKPFEKFDRFIPADATEFALDGFLDVERLYHVVLDFVEKQVPNGAQHISNFRAMLASVGFDPQRDLFSWWSGEIVSVSMPPAVVTPMKQADGVFMIRVKDAELAAAKVNAAIERIQAVAQREGQALMVMPAQVNADGFKQVSHPMLMMVAQPVVGIKGDWLMMSLTGAEPINKCLAVAAGDKPSIMNNERFRKEGLVPEGPVRGCSFTDKSRFGQEMAAVAGMAGMMGGMITAPIPDTAQMKPVKQIAQKGMMMVAKLAPVLAKIDFYSSQASISQYDGELTVRSETVVTYKPPKEKDTKPAPKPAG